MLSRTIANQSIAVIVMCSVKIRLVSIILNIEPVVVVVVVPVVID